ncbi:hypothetical protein AA13594_0891 [Gluconacetobacter azotocaptans DSM 13594]|nr:hypothetical protein AA13594_0891 [Gluconacetobacter azotocaptans DSM 13594]
MTGAGAIGGAAIPWNPVQRHIQAHGRLPVRQAHEGRKAGKTGHERGIDRLAIVWFHWNIPITT